MWTWVSMKPGVTIWPPASITSAPAAFSAGPTAAMRPAATPTSRTASMPLPGSSTRPPVMTVSKLILWFSTKAPIPAKRCRRRCASPPARQSLFEVLSRLLQGLILVDIGHHRAQRNLGDDSVGALAHLVEVDVEDDAVVLVEAQRAGRCLNLRAGQSLADRLHVRGVAARPGDGRIEELHGGPGVLRESAGNAVVLLAEGAAEGVVRRIVQVGTVVPVGLGADS